MFPHNPDHIDPALAVPARLRSLLQQVAEVLAQITADIARCTPIEMPIVLAAHRAAFSGVMNALGVGILDFLAEDPSPAHVNAVRAQVAAPIRAWSATSPVLNRLVRSSAKGARDFEVPALVIENRRVGADFSALIFNDFYLNSIAAQALRNRFAMLTRYLLQEVTQRIQAGINPVQVLNLKCDSGSELVTLADEPAFAATRITCLDGDAAALRAARARLDARLPVRARFLRVNALKYARSPLWRSQSYDISYAAALFDHLTTDQADALIRDSYGLLATGGTLILGSPTSGIPASERILIAWVMNVAIHYRDEPDFQRLFAQTPFGSEAVHFERESLGGDMLVIAQRP
jgi:SAM-dependent methyltransferase